MTAISIRCRGCDLTTCASGPTYSDAKHGLEQRGWRIASSVTLVIGGRKSAQAEGTCGRCAGKEAA